MAYPFYYNKQIKNYMVQLMSIFSALQVNIGKDGGEVELIDTPIHYGNKDRVVAHIINEGTQNKLLRLPVTSAYLSGIDLDPSLRKGVGVERRTTYMPAGKVFPDDIKVAQQLMPVPYRARAEIAFFTSNSEQRFQLLEQILMLFDPTFQMQTSDAALDWSKITTVELENINFDDNYPTGTDRRIMVTTLTFNFPIYISAPADMKDNFIKDIWVRLGAVDAGSNTSAEMIDDLNSQGTEYEKWFTLDDIKL